MRMWNVDVTHICDKHLRAEHVEMHMFAGTIAAGKNISGFGDHGLVDTNDIKKRHDEIAIEMVARGGNHKSPIVQPIYDPAITSVNPAWNHYELARRCAGCRARMGSATGVAVYPSVPTGGDALRYNSGHVLWEVWFTGGLYGVFQTKDKALKHLETLRSNLYKQFIASGDPNWRPMWP